MYNVRFECFVIAVFLFHSRSYPVLKEVLGHFVAVSSISVFKEILDIQSPFAYKSPHFELAYLLITLK